MNVRYAVVVACLAGTLLLSVRRGSAQSTFSEEDGIHPGYLGTLFWGSGIIDVPVAWTPPVHGELMVHGSVHGFRNLAGDLDAAHNGTFGAFASLGGKSEVGVSALSDDAFALFGRVQVYGEGDAGGFPAIALGVRGISLSGGERGRFGLPCDCNMPVSFYGVTSDRTWVGPVSLGWSAGWGMGTFRQLPAGTAEEDYNDGFDTRGFFGGVRAAFPTGGAVQKVHAMADWNGWDLNVGVAVEAFDLQLGVFVTELENLGSDPAPGSVYNIPRLSVNLSTRTNVFYRGTGARGEGIDRLRTQVVALEGDLQEREREVQRLRGLLSQGAMPAEALAELQELRRTLRERIEEQEREIERLEAQLSALRAGRGTSGGG